MTKDSPMARENRARVPSSCVPTDAQRAASQAFATQFDRLREETDELLKLKRAAQQMLATRPASQFDSLCHLLDSLLPRDHDSQRRLARAVQIDPGVLQRLRASTLDPLDAPPTPMVLLSRAILMDFATFWTLAQRDHLRLVRSGAQTTARAGDDASRGDATLAAFLAAWERDERDDPPHGAAKEP